MHRFGFILAVRALCATGLACALTVPVSASAQTKAKNPAIFMYQGADRDQRLLENAKKEGTVTIYTSLNLKDSEPITSAFEKKYGIKTVLWRASGEKVVQRAVTEGRAGRYTPDVFESDGIEVEILAREKLLSEFKSPAFKDLPPEAFPPSRLYVNDRFNFFTIAYNTNLIKPQDVPNSYEELLGPKWKDKIGLEADDTDWFGAMVKNMGEQRGLEFFRKLADNKPQIRTGHTLISELVAAGEIPLAVAVYNHAVERLAKNGAPIRWKALNPTFGRGGAVGMAANAPHPNAALLFADFLLSREGQELIKQRDRVPANKAVDTPLNKFAFKMIDPVIVLDESDKWQKLWDDIFIKGQKAGVR
ncbi:MAG: transporter substrate-binding protein [Herbaspirillum sp.]|jgi:iron(III) transport system substrate-binding protein|nr:transporter substrate-binding protein [Herbaspirillum sp.]